MLIDGVRSFGSRQEFPLRPLTILVGENSSGKSTFLAIAACIFDKSRFPLNPGFNEKPFNLGNFEAIASRRKGRPAADESFSIGYSLGSENESQIRRAVASYQAEYGLPALASYEDRFGHDSIHLSFEGDRMNGEIQIESRDGAASPIEIRGAPFPHRDVPNVNLADLLHPAVLPTITRSQLKRTNGTIKSQLNFRSLDKFYRELRFRPFENVFAFSPIRSIPRRTYDYLSEEYHPEGQDIPSLLARILNEQAETEIGRRIKRDLVRFGKDSGLMTDIEVKSLGEENNGPFQIRVKVGGVKANLMDVGYGVSQVIPLIVRCVMHRGNNLFLIQQPEVHLHPRAQAALGTFFAELASSGYDNFVIETHSDYLLDRVRQEVAAGKVKPEQVQILFFDRPRAETKVYPIDLDEMGNIINAPEQYRQFFMDETRRLLLRGDT